MNCMRLKTKLFGGLFLSVLAFGLLLLPGCGKDEQPPIDTGYVNITIYPNSTEYLPLNSPGGFAYLYADPPSRGIIAYRLSSEEFRAFERTPTYKPDSCSVYNRVIVDESGFFMVDTCTGSKWLIIDGTVQGGPAKYALYAYKTFYDGYSLRIYN